MVSNVMTMSILPIGLELMELQYIDGNHWWGSAGQGASSKTMSYNANASQDLA